MASGCHGGGLGCASEEASLERFSKPGPGCPGWVAESSFQKHFQGAEMWVRAMA